MKNKYLWLGVLHTLVLIIVIIYKAAMQAKHINYTVVLAGNALLLLVGILILRIYAAALKNQNPNFFIRAVMGGVLIKLMVLGLGAFIYLLAAGANRSVNAIFVIMFLYIIYTYLEVKFALQLNKEHHG